MQTDDAARARLTVEMPRDTADEFIARSRHFISYNHENAPRAVWNLRDALSTIAGEADWAGCLLFAADDEGDWVAPWNLDVIELERRCRRIQKLTRDALDSLTELEAQA
jgi:hypothetical protein